VHRILLLSLAAATASCTTAPAPPSQTAQSRAHLEQLIAGKVAGQPLNCLPHYNADDMIVIDENTIAFRVSGRRVYVAHMNGPCANLGSSYTALVTNTTGSPGLCSGDIARVVDTANRITVGSCTFNEFTPYETPRS